MGPVLQAVVLCGVEEAVLTEGSALELFPVLGWLPRIDQSAYTSEVPTAPLEAPRTPYMLRKEWEGGLGNAKLPLMAWSFW